MNDVLYVTNWPDFSTIIVNAVFFILMPCNNIIVFNLKTLECSVVEGFVQGGGLSVASS